MILRGHVNSTTLNPSNLFPGSRVIEVVGGLANVCVPSATKAILNHGLYAYVDSSKLLSLHSDDTDKILEQMVKAEVAEAGIGQHLALGQKVSFYYNRYRSKPIF